MGGMDELTKVATTEVPPDVVKNRAMNYLLTHARGYNERHHSIEADEPDGPEFIGEEIDDIVSAWDELDAEIQQLAVASFPQVARAVLVNKLDKLVT